MFCNDEIRILRVIVQSRPSNTQTKRSGGNGAFQISSRRSTLDIFFGWALSGEVRYRRSNGRFVGLRGRIMIMGVLSNHEATKFVRSLLLEYVDKLF